MPLGGPSGFTDIETTDALHHLVQVKILISISDEISFIKTFILVKKHINLGKEHLLKFHVC